MPDLSCRESTAAHRMTPSSQVEARGILYVHSCTRALMPHAQWCLSKHFGSQLDLDWSPQPVQPGNYRTEVRFAATPGSAAGLASDLRRLGQVRFELVHDAAGDIPGERYCFTPNLGMYRSAIGPLGDAQISEDRIRAVMAESTGPAGTASADPATLVRALHGLLGTAWDEELEAFRLASAGDGVRWMNHAG